MRKQIVLQIVMLLIISTATSQIKLPVLHDSLFSTYYHQRVSFFREMPVTKKEIIFLGNSITDGAEWAQLFNDLRMKNQGISGDVTAGLLHRLDVVTNRKPAKIFLLIGTNDLARGINADTVLHNIYLLADYVKQQSPKTKLYVQSILPVNDGYGKFAGHTKNNEIIKQVNGQLQANAAAHQYMYIDLHSYFVRQDGKLEGYFTNDGLHLMGSGYRLWKNILYPYLYNRRAKLPKEQRKFID